MINSVETEVDVKKSSFENNTWTIANELICGETFQLNWAVEDVNCVAVRLLTISC